MSNDNNNSSDKEEQIFITSDALWFDGKASYIDCGSLSPFKVAEAITVEAVVKRDEDRNYYGHDGGHVVNMGGGWDNNGFSLFVYNECTRIELQNTSRHQKAILDNQAPPKDKWTHLAFSWSLKSGTIKFYINGVLQANTGKFTVPIGVPNQHLFIGLNQTQGFPFKGFIKHVRIWTCERSQDEIKEGMFHICDPSQHLIAQYILEDKNASERCTHQKTHWSASNVPLGSIRVPSSDIGSCFKQLVNNPSMSDITFFVEKEKIYAHKCILICRSDYMKSLLGGQMKEASQKEIEVKEISAKLFLKFIEFCYTDRIEIPQKLEDVAPLLRVADEYAVKRMKSLLEVHLAKLMSISNIFELLKLSDQYSAFQLQELCKSFIEQNAAKLKGTPEYREFVLESSK